MGREPGTGGFFGTLFRNASGVTGDVQRTKSGCLPAVAWIVAAVIGIGHATGHW